MDRRTFLAATGAVLLAAPLAAQGQQAAKIHRIGLLDYSTPDQARLAWWEGFLRRMSDLGYVQGQTVAFERRWAPRSVDPLIVT